MLFLAATALDKLKDVPPTLWWKVGLCMVGFLVVVLVFQRVMQINKVFLTIGTLVVTAILFFSWVYNRNEPAFLTPLVDRIAPWFPSAGAFASSQQQDLSQPAKKKAPAPLTTVTTTIPSHVY